MESKINTSIKTYTNKINNYSATHNNQNTYNPQTITIKSPVASDTINNTGNSNNQSNSDLVNGIRTFVDNLQERASRTAAFFGDGLRSLGNNANNYIETEVLPTLENIGDAVGNTLLRTSATIDTAIVSLTEGLGQAGGALIDGTVNIGNALATPIYGLVDLGQHASVSLFGGEYHSLTERMWKDAKAFVSEEFVSPFYDEFYETNQTGKFLKDYAYGFKTTRELGDGVGYVGGIIITSILTAGAGDAASIGTAIASTGGTQAAIAGVAGLGKGSQEAWQDGATVREGLAYGTLSGGWEAFQFWLGAQIAGSKLFIPATKGATVTVGNKILNSLSKVAMDGIDGGAEGFIQPLLKEIYKDGYYDQDGIYHDFNEESGRTIWDNYKSLFEENGGFKTVATNAAIGSIVSAIGEGIDVNRFIRNTRSGLNYYAFDNINSVTEDFLDKLDLETSMFVIDGKTYSGTELNDLLKNSANGNNTSNQAKNNKKLKPEVQKLHDEMDTILSKAKEDGRFSFFEFDYLKNLLDSRVDDIENYEYFYGIIKDFDGKCNLSRKSGEYLNQILKDQNSVFAIHRTNLGEITKNAAGIPENSILSKIMDEGLINNGHALSGGGGAVSLTPDLNLTTTPLSGISGFLNLVGSYKDNNVTVILKFPDDLVSKDLVRGAENVHITKGNMSYINPDYIAGAIVKDANGFDQFFTKEQILSKNKFNNFDEILGTFSNTSSEKELSQQLLEKIKNGDNLTQEELTKLLVNDSDSVSQLTKIAGIEK